MDDDISCPKCKTTKYRNPSLKLMVNTCGHGLCENCVDLLFAKGSGACPQCEVPLRRANFRFQVFEDSFVEKEVDIRRKILRDYNKREEDFASLREYNDYLEEVEDIIYKLSNDINVDALKRQVEQYRKDNQEFIIKNRSKKSKDQEFIEDLIEEERELQVFRKQNLVFDDQAELRKVRAKQKDALVDELMYSDQDASQILASHADQQKRVEQKEALRREQKERQEKEFQERQRNNRGTVFSTGIQLGRGGSGGFLPVPKPSDAVAEIYQYRDVSIDLDGPPCPAPEELEPDGYLLHVRNEAAAEKAGGFLSVYPCQRALQEAFCGLYFESQ